MAGNRKNIINFDPNVNHSSVSATPYIDGAAGLERYMVKA